MSNLEKIRVLLYRGESLWLAQALEYDFCVQGKTIEEAISRLDSSIADYMTICEEEGVEPFSDMEPVSQDLLRRFEDAELIPRNLPTSIRIHQVPAEIRAAA